MSEGKHTPGPWEMISGTDEHGCNSIVEILSPYEPDAQFQVALTNGPWDMDGNASEECIANARLIAAAPDMLAIIKEILHAEIIYTGAIEESIAACGLDSVAPLKAKIEAAIAKAEGAS